jgi:hypothetical protein
MTAHPPPRRRTFGSRPVTRAALVLLVTGVLVAAWIQQRSGSDEPPAPSPTATASTTSTAPASR